MVFAHQVNRVTFSGTMFGGQEEWSTGFFIGEEGADANSPTQTMANRLLVHWTTFFEAFSSHVNQNYLTTQVKVAALSAGGPTIPDQVVYAYPGAVLDGGDPNNTHPPQCAIVVTLLSDRPRGLASKGRMYLPGICAAIDGTGRISGNDRDNIATNIKTFFNSVRADADIPNTPILAAKGIGPFPALTAQNDYIEKIKVGNVVDTQRRRRNGLAESYKTETLT
jgi:hypothetical protein